VAGTYGADLEILLVCDRRIALSQMDGQVAVHHIDIEDMPEKKDKATMADVTIYMGQSGMQGRVQGNTIECRRGIARPGPAALFSLTLYDFLTTSPFGLMRRFSENINRFFEGMSSSISVMNLWSPSIAISEKDGQIKVCAELPGLSKDDVRVELSQDELTISGERRRDQQDRREGVYWSERFCHSFMRIIPIPDEAQLEKVKATFDDEILTVSVPVSGSRGSHGLSARVRADLERAEELN
jgi:HSP20 family protein